MYDVSLSHRADKENAEKKINELKKQFPKDYFFKAEFRELQELIRQANRSIKDYDHKIKMGVKF